MATKPIVNPTTSYASLSGTQSLALIDNSYAPLYASINDVQTYQNYILDTGVANAYALALPTGWANTGGLTAGLLLQWRAAHVNTGAATLNFNSLGPVAILRPNGNALLGGDIPLNGIVVTQFDGANWQLLSPLVSTVGTGFPRGTIDGLLVTPNGTILMDIANGVCRDSTDTLDMVNGSTITKTQAAWAAGSGSGGRFSAAAMAANTWYFFYLIRKDSDGSIDTGFDTSPNAANRPAGYTYFRYIMSRRTAIGGTTWSPIIQRGGYTEWNNNTSLDYNAAPNGTRQFVRVQTPALPVQWYGRVAWGRTSGSGSETRVVTLTDPSITDQAPVLQSSPLSDAGWFGVPSVVIGSQVTCWTNASGQVGIRGTSDSGSATIQVYTTGWYDQRGQNS